MTEIGGQKSEVRGRPSEIRCAPHSHEFHRAGGAPITGSTLRFDR